MRKLFLGIMAAALTACAAPPAAAPAPTMGRASSAECFSGGVSVLKLNGIRKYNFYSYGHWEFTTESGLVSTNATCVVTE